MGGATEHSGVAEGHAESSGTTIAGASSSGSVDGGFRSSPRNREKRMRTVVEDQGVYRSSCGYCKASPRSSVAHGLWAYGLTVQDYQDLLDRGWRRSGMFLYKPSMKTTCCPPYTIRLKADSFVAKKDQMRVLSRMQRYLDGKIGGQSIGELHNDKDNIFERGVGLPCDEPVASVSDRTIHCKSSTADVCSVNIHSASETAATQEEVTRGRLRTAIETALRTCVETGSLPHTLESPTILVKQVPQKVKSKLNNLEGSLVYTSSIAFALAALLKRRSKIEISGDEILKEQADAVLCFNPQDISEMLVGSLLELPEIPGFTVRAVGGHLNFFVQERNSSSPTPFQTREKASCPTNEKHLLFSKQSISTPFGNVGQLEIKLRRSAFDPEEFALYKKYQVVVHNDRPEDVKEGSYRRFLVDTPLVFVPPVNGGGTPSCGFGSFHQQYLINGRLVAVGVVDILPNCLSSKYLFWDPDLAFLALGKYSAIQEIKWVQQAQKVCSSLQYYYLGFYIHTCPKMRYKASYYPSELLCPVRFTWVAYEFCKPFLDKQSYVCLSDIAPNIDLHVESSTRAERHQEPDQPTCLNGGDRQNAMEVEIQPSNEEYEDESITPRDNFLVNSIQTVDDSSDTLGHIQLYLNGACLSFKHLQELALVPRWHLDALVHRLQRYLEVVGPSLATRMAYALS